MTRDAAAPLSSVLRRYVDARESALLAKRRALDASDLDARAFAFIHDNPGSRPSDIAARFAVSTAAVTTLVDRLESRGVVERVRDDRDRRIIRLHATPRAQAAGWVELVAFDDAVDMRAARESTEDQRRTVELIERLLASS